MTNTRHAGLFSRRRFLKTSAGAAFMAGAALPTPAISQGATKIKMTLPWLPQGAQLFPFIARNKGYWRSRGLEVEIARGFGSGAAIQALSQSQFDVALIATPTVLLSNARGLETVSMGIAGYDITMGLMSLEDGPVKSVKDLEGRRLGSTPTSVEVPYIAPFMERSGVTMSKSQPGPTRRECAGNGAHQQAGRCDLRSGHIQHAEPDRPRHQVPLLPIQYPRREDLCQRLSDDPAISRCKSQRLPGLGRWD